MRWMRQVGLLLLLVYTGLAVAQDTLRVRVLGLPPLTFQNAQGQWTGLDVELAQVLLAQAGIRPVYQVAPWKRSLLQLESGDLDLMMNLSMTEERKRFIHFFGPSRDETIVLVVPKRSQYVINSLDDIKKLRGKIGIQIGSYYGEAFDRKFKTDPAFAAKFDLRSVDQMNIKKLKADRIIGWFADVYAIAYHMRNDPEYAEVKAHPFVINRDVVYFGVSKKSVSAATIARLEQAWVQAQAAGQFEKVLKRYR